MKIRENIVFGGEKPAGERSQLSVKPAQNILKNTVAMREVGFAQ